MGGEDYRIRKMARLISDRPRVLDLGWARIPNKHLANSEVVGLDLNTGELPANYSRTEIGNVMDLPSPFKRGSFDAIQAGEIIEHLERPVDFLRGCFETVKPGGMIVLSTPNPNSPFERLLTIPLSRRVFYTAEHVSLYPQRWLIRMMETAGFTSVKLYSGGMQTFVFGLVPFPRPWCYQTIATGIKKA